MAEPVKSVSFQEKSGEKKEENRGKPKQSSLDRLQCRLAPLVKNPYYAGHLDLSSENLTRWLDASDNSALLAEARLRASLALWKKARRTLADPDYTPPYAMKKHFGGGMCGTDRQGSPVYFQLFGLTDMMGIVQSCTREQMITHWIFQISDMIDKIRKKTSAGEKTNHNILLIVDFQGWSFSNLRWPVLCAWAQALQLYQDLCPGLFKEILLIHPPCALPVLHRFMAACLKRSTRERTAVIGPHNCLRHLLLRLEKHEIPAYLGGYKCDIDNNMRCRQDILWADKVPRWVYLTDPCLPADIINMSVPAGGSAKQQLHVTVEGTRIVWKLYNVTHPITLFITSPDLPPVSRRSGAFTIKPRPLITASLKVMRNPQGGAIVCNAPGTHNLILDNSKNLMHTVRAQVKIEVIPPENFLARYAHITTLGDSIDFSKPVTADERQRRKEMIMASKDCHAIDIDAYY